MNLSARHFHTMRACVRLGEDGEAEPTRPAARSRQAQTSRRLLLSPAERVTEKSAAPRTCVRVRGSRGQAWSGGRRGAASFLRALFVIEHGGSRGRGLLAACGAEGRAAGHAPGD